MGLEKFGSLVQGHFFHFGNKNQALLGRVNWKGGLWAFLNPFSCAAE
jgi:hypothetical protein